MHDTKEHINYGKSHREKSGKKIFQNINHDTNGGAFFGRVWVSVCVSLYSGHEHQATVSRCKKCKFIFIFYKLILMVSPTLW